MFFSFFFNCRITSPLLAFDCVMYVVPLCGTFIAISLYNVCGTLCELPRYICIVVIPIRVNEWYITLCSSPEDATPRTS